jgi:hypothetical protein
MEGLVSDGTAAARPADPTGVMTPTERPVTFRDVFAIREFRAVYLALIANWVGEYLSRAAITVLVFQQTRSVLLSAASFAISYLPWIAGGPVLAALAERYPYRRVMVVCDVIRLTLMALLVIPGLPIAVLLVLLFMAMLASPPTQAARSALLPLLLGRDRLVTALAANSTTAQAAQVVGYFAGATLAAAVNPRLAILAVVVAYAISASLVALGVKARPAARSGAQRTHLLQETAEGFHLVLGNRVLRAIALMAIALTIFAIVPEGLAAAWAAQANPNPATRGFDQGMIVATVPVGWVIGGVVFARFVRPAVRQRLIRPLAVISPLALVPALTAPSVQFVALLTMLSGIAQGGLLPVLNGHFVLSLPHGYRARAFAVIQGGMQLAQGSAVLATGLLAEHARVPIVVGFWSVGGTLLMVGLVAGWPSAASFERAMATAAESDQPDVPAHGDTQPADTNQQADAQQAGSHRAGSHRAGTREADTQQAGETQPAQAPQPAHNAQTGDAGLSNGTRPVNGSDPGIAARPRHRATRITPDHR